jgi:hypothetical protein
LKLKRIKNVVEENEHTPDFGHINNCTNTHHPFYGKFRIVFFAYLTEAYSLIKYGLLPDIRSWKLFQAQTK